MKVIKKLVLSKSFSTFLQTKLFHTPQIFPIEGSKETYSLTENFSTGLEDVRITFCAFGLADITGIKKRYKMFK